jgi:hypothetical protein
VDTSTLFVDSSTNRVGLGVTSPAHKLELAAATTAEEELVLETDTELYRSAAKYFSISFRRFIDLVSGAFQVAGTNVITSARIIQAADGTAAAPSFTFSARY